MPAPIKMGRSQRLGEEPLVKTAAHAGHLKQKTSENVTLPGKGPWFGGGKRRLGGVSAPRVVLGQLGGAQREGKGRGSSHSTRNVSREQRRQDGPITLMATLHPNPQKGIPMAPSRHASWSIPVAGPTSFSPG